MTFIVSNFTICSNITFHYKRKQPSISHRHETLSPKAQEKKLFNIIASDKQKDIIGCTYKAKTPNTPLS